LTPEQLAEFKDFRGEKQKRIADLFKEMKAGR
jgi:hypothetical protein